MERGFFWLGRFVLLFFLMFKHRSLKPERIDTGDYTPEEFESFLQEIRFINRFFGDRRVLRKTLFSDIERENLRKFSVLDVGAGSGELLRAIAEFARENGRTATLTGLDLNAISARSIAEEGQEFNEITSVRGDALKLPFDDNSFDYAISSLFTHHLSDENIVEVLREMDRVARKGIYIIDLHRHPLAYALYKAFCVLFRISQLVRHDGSLSILKGFKPREMKEFGEAAGLENTSTERYFPFRVVLESK